MPVYRTASANSSPAARAARDLEVLSHSVDQTRRYGMRLASLLEPGDLVLLEGDFGAG